MALTVFIVILASFTAFNLVERFASARGRERLSWLGCDVVSMGIGIASTEAGEISFTVSIGAVAVDRADSGTPAETILNFADAALYQAKDEGRDRVVIAKRLSRASQTQS
jgi:GGDEF domain-containing protein